MQLRNCPECDRLFTYVNRNLCPACIEAEEAEFERVRLYVRDHRNSTIPEVSEATGVSADKIILFLREGRLVANGLVTEGFLQCESCGQPVSSGRLCDKCRDELTDGINRLNRLGVEQPPQPTKITQKWRTKF